MLELVFVRHCETDYCNYRVLKGHEDVPLNEEGKKQSKEIADTLSEIEFDAILCSDRQRCIYPAELHTDFYPGLEIIKLPSLRERNFGDHTNRRITDLGYEDSRDGMIKHLYDCHCPRGESKWFFFYRVVKTIQDLYKHFPNKRIALHTHTGFISFAINYVVKFRLSSDDPYFVERGNVSYLKFEKSGSEYSPYTVQRTLTDVPPSSLLDCIKKEEEKKQEHKGSSQGVLL